MFGKSGNSIMFRMLSIFTALLICLLPVAAMAEEMDEGNIESMSESDPSVTESDELTAPKAEESAEPEESAKLEGSVEPAPTATPAPTEEPEPTEAASGKLKVSVKKEGNIAADCDETFSYTVSCDGKPVTGNILIGDTATQLTPQGGFKLKANATATIPNLPEGSYKVVQHMTEVGCITEVKVNGAASERTNTDWNGVAVNVAVGSETANLEFTNIFESGSEPEPTATPKAPEKYYDLKISKVVKGEDADKDAEFKIKVTFDAKGKFKTSEGYRIESGDYVTLKDGESITIYNLPEGVSYKVRERHADENGYKTTYRHCSGKLNADTRARVTNTLRSDSEEGLAKTGDNGNSQLYIALMLAAAAVMAGAVAGMRRKHSEQ